MNIFNLNTPKPVKVFESGNTKIQIYEKSSDAALASVLNIGKNQIKLVKEKSEASIMIMAAPSGYDFYKEYINVANSCKELQLAIKKTHFFQLDEYLLPYNHPATFRYLLEKNLFSKISNYIDNAKIHLFEADSYNYNKICNEYSNFVLKFGPDIQVKGQGEDAHWGFNQPDNFFFSEPGIIKIKLNKMNKIQQMRDHPRLFRSIRDVPKFALTGNISLFMKTKFLIEDIVPQSSKAFAVLISYGNDSISPICPSGKIKEYNGISIARLNIESAWALIEYKEKGYLSRESILRLDMIWNKISNKNFIEHNKKYVRNTLDSLRIRYQDY